MFKKKKKLSVSRWNIFDYLTTTKEIAAYLEAALEENDDEYLKIAVRDAIMALKRIKNAN